MAESNRRPWAGTVLGVGTSTPLDSEQLALFPEWWESTWEPEWPYAADVFPELRRMPRDEAKGKRYLQANPDKWTNLVVVDVDHGDAALRALSTVGSHPMPNLIVTNPRNGHAHVGWVIAEPVTRTEYASRKATAYLAAVTEGLRRAVDGDKGYNGLLTKNPLHGGWASDWVHPDLYDLGQIEEALGRRMPPKTWRRSRSGGVRSDVAGLGRNCFLFEHARVWAYREVRHHFGDPAGLLAAIEAAAYGINATEFAEPLPLSEVRHIAHSIWRWITTRSRMWADGPAVYEATFTTIQSHRGRKSGEKRSAAAAAEHEQMKEFAR